MATINYCIRTNKTDETPVSVWANIFISKTETRSDRVLVHVNTGLKTPANIWKDGSIDVWKADKTQQALYKSVNEDMFNLKGLFLAHIAEHKTITPQDAAGIVTDYINRTKANTVQAPKDIVKYLEWRIQGMKDGSILNQGKQYAANTIKEYGNLLALMKRFYPAFRSKFGVSVNPTWSIFENEPMANSFVKFCEQEYRVKTRNKYVKMMRELIHFAQKNGITSASGDEYLKTVSEESQESKELTTHVYLTESEIQALFDMPLSGTYAQVRDIFLLGCYTGQRVSDYSRLSKEMFGVTRKGTKVIRLQQVKTKNTITIPVLTANIETILDRYPEGLPQFCDVILNRYIKYILEELSATVPSLAEMRKVLLTMKDKARENNGIFEFDRLEDGTVIRPRYELVTTHTARRSCITNLYLRDIFSDEQIMSISGHKDRTSYLKYISLSSDEIADQIAHILAAEKDKRQDKELF